MTEKSNKKVYCAIQLLVMIVMVLAATPTMGKNLLGSAADPDGRILPAGWHVSGGEGKILSSRNGKAILEVVGNLVNSPVWLAPTLPLTGGETYRFDYMTRNPNGGNGIVVGGAGSVNRDFAPGINWHHNRYIFRFTDADGQNFVRLGQWDLDGTTQFKTIKLIPVEAVNRQDGGVVLGEGEQIAKGVYTDTPDYNWFGSNVNRALVRATAGFNSNRWIFTDGTEVIYQHTVGKYEQESGEVTVEVNYRDAGQLFISASRDGFNWTPLGSMGAVGRQSFKIPNDLLPAKTMEIRLNRPPNDGGGMLEVDAYQYRSRLAGDPPNVVGDTQFVEIKNSSSVINAKIEQIKSSTFGKVSFMLTNRSNKSRHLICEVVPDKGTPGRLSTWVNPDKSSLVIVPFKLEKPGSHTIKAQVLSGRTVVYEGAAQVTLSILDDSSYGEKLPGPKSLGLWTCGSGWKVGRKRLLPVAHANGIFISLAGNEYEDTQLVVKPERPLTLTGLRVSDLIFRHHRIAASQISVKRVAYVQVTVPTDSSCVTGKYPDPLPPLVTPLKLPADRNQPFWITVHTEAGQPAGIYRGNIRLQTSDGSAVIPLKVKVYAFSLPKRFHLRSGLGVDAGAINQYFHLKTDAEKRLVWKKTMDNFARHRISPYNFAPYDPISLTFTGSGEQIKPVLHFSAFDQQAHIYLDEMRFNGFVLPIEGMGGGRYPDYTPGTLDGFKQGTPEYERLFREYLSALQQHLKQKGWLSKAYVYWFDEPSPQDFPFVIKGMQQIHRAAPLIKRLLTKQPAGALPGNVDIWCALTPYWTPQLAVKEKKSGDEVWWYICTGPKAPYLGEFIDHPGVQLRLWPWQSWQYGVQGILIWDTTYWNSPALYPPPKVPNPWKDPESYVYGNYQPNGYVGRWGNGDGRFLYPPDQDPNQPSKPILMGPISSTRWENLRDGMEDYEYLWMLKRRVDQLSALNKKSGQLNSDLVRAKRLLVVPPDISVDTTHFTSSPRPIMRRREQIAQMIERLDRWEEKYKVSSSSKP
ncbi:MAG: DUF4091 domain-containing protein [Armatimonadetes bacterium]|nr:DUF4091 domain-containing protein [Armatimonadota bacterium]